MRQQNSGEFKAVGCGVKPRMPAAQSKTRQDRRNPPWPPDKVRLPWPAKNFTFRSGRNWMFVCNQPSPAVFENVSVHGMLET